MPHLTHRERADVRTCDADCRVVNACHGHVECRACGRPYCPRTEGHDGLCTNCSESEE